MRYDGSERVSDVAVKAVIVTVGNGLVAVVVDFLLKWFVVVKRVVVVVVVEVVCW